MIGKCVQAALAFACIGANDILPARTESGINPSARPEVVRVICEEGRGSAFYVGPRTLVSVAHVTTNTDCRINGRSFTVIAQKNDFSVLRVAEPVDRWLKVDCGGFVPGKTYEAWGFARGLPTLTSVDSEANGRKWGLSRLWGVFHVVPGQSGGPFIIPGTDRAVGTVNVYNHERGDSGSVALRETSLCA